MLISRHVFRRISRCPFGIVQMCVSLFLWLYQYILRPNNQKKPGPVEHHCFEGKSHNFVYVTNRFKLKQLSQVIDLKNSTINLHFSFRLCIDANNHASQKQATNQNHEQCVLNALNTFASFCFVRHKPSSVHRE